MIFAGLVTNFVLSQRVIYGARPDGRSRIGGLFTALFFLGGALGSALATASFVAGGWHLTCATGVRRSPVRRSRSMPASSFGRGA